MGFIIKYLHEIYVLLYSPYLVAICLIAGGLALFSDTSYANFYNNNKDFVISFFSGILLIIFSFFLILLKLLHARYII